MYKCFSTKTPKQTGEDVRRIMENIVKTLDVQMAVQIAKYNVGNLQQQVSAKTRMCNVLDNAITCISHIVAVSPVAVTHYKHEALIDLIEMQLEIIRNVSRDDINGWCRVVSLECRLTMQIVLALPPTPQTEQDTEVVRSAALPTNEVPLTIGALGDVRRNVIAPAWDVPSVGRKEILAASLQFQHTDAPGSVTPVLQVPDIITNASLRMLAMQNFQQFKYNAIRVTVRFSPTMFTCGRYILHALPRNHSDASGPEQRYARASANQYSVELDLSRSTTAVLEIPWLESVDLDYTTSVTLAGTESHWKLFMVCVSPYTDTSGARTTLPYQVSFSVSGYQAYLPKPENGPQTTGPPIPHVVTRPGLAMSDYLVAERQLTRDLVPRPDGVKMTDLMHRLSIITTAQWSTADAPGKLLAVIQVGPSYGIDYVSPTTPPAMVNWHQAVASYYGWWTGSDIFAIDPVTTSKMTGALLLCWIADQNIPDPTDIHEATMFKHTILNLNEQASDHMATLTTEWNAPRAFRRVIWSAVNSNNHLEFNGRIVLFVYNPLIVPSGTTAQTVDILIRHQPGPDRDFKIPTTDSPIGRSVSTIRPENGPGEEIEMQDMNPAPPSYIEKVPDIDAKLRSTNPAIDSTPQPTDIEPGVRNETVASGRSPITTLAGRNTGGGPSGSVRFGTTLGAQGITGNSDTIKTVGSMLKSVVDIGAGIATLALCPEPFTDAFTRPNWMFTINTTTATNGWFDTPQIDFSAADVAKWTRRLSKIMPVCKGFNFDVTFYIWAQASLNQNLIITHIPYGVAVPTSPLNGFEAYGGATYAVGTTNTVIPYSINAEMMNRFYTYSVSPSATQFRQTSLGALQFWMPNVPTGTAINISVFAAFNNTRMYGPTVPPGLAGDVSTPDFPLSARAHTPRVAPRTFHVHQWTDNELASLHDYDDHTRVRPELFGINEAMDSIRNAGDAVTGLVDQVRNIVTTTAKGVAIDIDKTINIIIHLYMLVSASNIKQFCATALALLMTAGLSVSTVTRLLQGRLPNQPNQGVRPESDPSSIVGRVVAAFVSIFCFKNATTNLERTWKFIEWIGTKARPVVFLEKGITACKKLCEYVTSVVKWGISFFDHAESDDDLLKSVHDPDQLLKFAQFVTAAESDAGFVELLNDPFMTDILDQWTAFATKRLLALMRESAATGRNPDPILNGLMNRYFDRFMTVHNKLIAERKNISSERMHPYFVCIAGPPRAGKSFFLRKLTKALVDEFQYNRLNSTYTRNCADRYFSGYAQQPIFVMDDAYQRMDANSTEPEEIVAMGSTAPYLTVQADLPNKGRPFTSHVVLICTNTPYPEWTGRNQNDSIWARRHTMVWAHPHTDEGGLCFTKINPLVRTPTPPAKDWASGATCSEDALIREILTNARAHLARQALSLDDTPGANALRMRFAPQPENDRQKISMFPTTRTRHERLVNTSIRYRIAAGDDALLALLDGIEFTRDERGHAEAVIALEPRLAAVVQAINLGAIQVIWLPTSVPDDTIWESALTVGKSTWYSWFNKLKGCISLNWNTDVVIAIVYMCLAAFTVYCCWDSQQYDVYMTPRHRDPRVPEGAYNATQARGHPVSVRVPRVENGPSQNTMDIIRARALKYDIRVVSQRGSVCGFPLKGRYIMCPYHNVCGDVGPIDVYVNNLLWTVGADCVYRFPDYDLAIIAMPRNCNAFPDNTRLFQTEACSILRRELTLCSVVPSADDPLYAHSARLDTFVGYPLADGSKVVMPRHYNYECGPLTIGYCGTILCDIDNNKQRPFVGFHVAGHHGEAPHIGYANVLTCEVLEQCLALCAPPGIIGADTPVAGPHPECLPQVDHDVAILRIGKVAPSDGVNLPSVSSLRPSILAGCIQETECGPAMLSKHDPRNTTGVDPIGVSVAKFGKHMQFLPGPVVDFGKRVLREQLRHLDRSDVRVWTETEAINGTGRTEYHHGIDMTTSPGHPYCKLSGAGRGKTWLFSLDDSGLWHATHPTLCERLVGRLQAATNNERYPSVWVDIFKDEKRPLAKVLAGKTRVITVGPLDYLVVFRQYFGEFVSCFYAAHNNISSAIGMNPESIEWDVLYTYLRRVSPVGFDADYSNFDGSITPDLIDAIGDLVNEWYGDGHDQVRRVLLHELSFTDHLMRRDLFVTLTGHPSGNPMTSIINTMANVMILSGAWYALIRRDNAVPATPDNFRRNVAIKAYGDDNIVAVSCDHAQVFNRATIADFLGNYGFDMTTATKGSAHGTTVEPIEQLQFLRRGFRKCERLDVMHAPIDLRVITELTNWIRACPDESIAAIDNARDALRFAVQHGPRVYCDLRACINHRLAALGLPELDDEYDDYHHYVCF